MAALCLVTVWGCSESPDIDEEQTEQRPGGEGEDDGDEPATPRIEFDAETDTEPEIAPEGGVTEVTFTATADWSADVAFTRAEQWCTVYPDSGNAGTATVTITAEPNETAEERSATVTIKCGESAAITVTVTQAGGEVEQPVPRNEIRYTSSDGKTVEPYIGPGSVEHPFGEGISIVSNVYENGRGIITCDGDITTIGYAAFYECSNLTSIIIPDGVTDIGQSAFCGCSSMTSINIPDGVTAIESNAFYNCSNLTSITIPDGVTSIGDMAFTNCANLKSITLPDSVTTIGYAAFSECIGLTSITLPDSVTDIGDGAFTACAGITAFYGKFATEDNRCLIIDKTLKAFAVGCGLSSYTIPNSVTAIGYGAFAYYDNLTSITIPDGVTAIGVSAFYRCRNLTSIKIPDGVTIIDSGAFQSCGLTSVTIPDSVTNIGDWAFADCPGMTAFYGKFASEDNKCLIVDDTLKAFAIGCGLTSYTVPDRITVIGPAVFGNCTDIKSITFSGNGLNIGSQAFFGCTALTSITFSDKTEGIVIIGSQPFYGCENLTAIYCKAVIPPYFFSIFAPFDDTDANIYVPEQSVGAYKSAQGWALYADRIVGYNY